MSDPVVDVKPVPVLLIGDETTKEESPTFGSWKSYKLQGTEVAQQILPQTDRRARAIIWVTPGIPAGNNAGAVYFGTQAQTQNPNPSDVAGILVNMTQIEIQSQQAVWMVPDGSHALTVTVYDEQYRR